MRKSIVMTGLVAIAVGAVVAGELVDDSIFDDFWSELFWLAVAAIVITVVLEGVLNQDLQSRRRAEDQFAFRTFTGTMADQLVKMVGIHRSADRSAAAAALGTSSGFLSLMEEFAGLVENAEGVDPEEYLRSQLNISNGLIDLSRSFVRLYSEDRKEMVERYVALQDLASRWRYLDELSERSREYLSSLDVTDPVRKAGLEKLAEAQRKALGVTKETARLLASLAERASGRGIPAVG